MGKKEASTTGVDNSDLNDATSLRIGNADGDSSRFWDGKLDEARIYNRVLSQEEITRLYNMGK